MLRSDLIDQEFNRHVEWLRQFGNQNRIKKFNQLKQQNREGAICEAFVCGYLCTHVDKIEPYEDISNGGPDFKCIQNGSFFYVEVTALSNKSVEDASWIPDDGTWKGGAVGSLSRLIRTAVSGKVRQCIKDDGPTLVALGINHTWVSAGVDGLARDVLISDESYVIQVSPDQPIPQRSGEFVTELRNAIFMAVGEKGVLVKRPSVAGALICGLGIQPPRIVGVINCAAHRPFDVKLLPEIKFAKTVIKDNRVEMRWL